MWTRWDVRTPGKCERSAGWKRATTPLAGPPTEVVDLRQQDGGAHRFDYPAPREPSDKTGWLVPVEQQKRASKTRVQQDDHIEIRISHKQIPFQSLGPAQSQGKQIVLTRVSFQRGKANHFNRLPRQHGVASSEGCECSPCAWHNFTHVMQPINHPPFPIPHPPFTPSRLDAETADLCLFPPAAHWFFSRGTRRAGTNGA